MAILHCKQRRGEVDEKRAMAVLRCKQSIHKEKKRKAVAVKSKVEEVSFGSGDKWVRGDKIGEGGFGVVFIATSKSRYIYLLHMPKAMAIKSAKMKYADSIKYELEVFNELEGRRCPYIIEHYGEEVTLSNQGDEIYNLALEIAWGSLSRLIRIHVNGLPESLVRSYTGEILEGVHHMHKAGFVHCDLKPDNILLVKDVVDNVDDDVPVTFTAKVGDLGLAKKEEVRTRWRGTPPYLAPETVLDDNTQEKPSDIWAVGLIVLEMLTGEQPRNHFYHHDNDTLYVVDGLKPRIPDTVSSLAREFIGMCLEEVPEHRFTAEELLAHPFVADVSPRRVEKC